MHSEMTPKEMWIASTYLAFKMDSFANLLPVREQQLYREKLLRTICISIVPSKIYII